MKSWRMWSLAVDGISTRWRESNVAPAALALAIATIAFNSEAGSAQQIAEPDVSESTFRAIADCLSEGKEYVLGEERVVPTRGCYTHGDRVALKGWSVPFVDEDWDNVCHNVNDSRRLPANVIKRLATERKIAPTGIRIIGAVFCGGPGDAGVALDLAGLDLSYSLIIDRSVVNGTIDARNLRVKGDFSFDNTVILDTLRLNRARVDGSVYGGNSFLKRLRVTDTQIAGSWNQADGVIFSDARFAGVKISDGVDMSNSAFSGFRLETGHVDGTLNLDHTQARCAYDIKASAVGYLTADHAGFGKMQTEAGAVYPWWDPDFFTGQHVMHMLSSSRDIKKIFDKEKDNNLAKTHQQAGVPLPGCEKISQNQDLKFNVSDSSVEAVFCITSFSWISPKWNLPDGNHPLSVVALNNTKINGDLIVNLWGDARTEVATLAPNRSEFDRVSQKHKFEAIGLTAHAFIFAFSDAQKPYITYLDGLKFDRIRKMGKPSCEHSPAADQQDVPRSPSGSADDLMPPTEDEVLRWLDKNDAPSSQPFKAFADGFDQAGDSTTDLRVGKMTFDLCARTGLRGVKLQGAKLCSARGFDWLKVLNWPAALNIAQPIDWNSEKCEKCTIGDMINSVVDTARIGFQLFLYVVADHGLRPERVVIPIVIVLLIFWILFWKVWRIVGFESNLKHRAGFPPPGQAIQPIGILFLFDHLIPLYHIREEHYSIGRVFRKARLGETAGEYRMDYHGRTIALQRLGDRELRKVEKWLVSLRIIGAVLSVFLLAAIHSLTS
jgi:hypothetical protein